MTNDEALTQRTVDVADLAQGFFDLAGIVVTNPLQRRLLELQMNQVWERGFRRGLDEAKRIFTRPGELK